MLILMLMLQALLDTKQARLVSTTVELEQLQERMRRGRFYLIHEQVQEARFEIERRVLQDMELQVLKAQSAAEAASRVREERLLKAVEGLAGHDVAAAVQEQLKNDAEVTTALNTASS